jgi:serine/threonine-protein kinase
VSTEHELPEPERIEELFAHALELAVADRPAWLQAECRGQPGLRAAVESLLAANDSAPELPDAIDAARAARLLDAVHERHRVRAVGPYRIVSEVGQGGMGTVYLAERAAGGFEQRVALKLVNVGMDSAAILERFGRERQILARLEHPGIARLLDGGRTETGRPYFAMEFVDGEPITRHAESRGLAIAARIELFLQVCDAVGEAHRELVVHRDLKPSNILVTAEGRVKLVDFGIAKLLDPGESNTESGTPASTRSGLHALTPRYASPEQMRGEPITTATDVYGLGVVLFELLTGRLPYEGPLSTPEQLVRAVCEEEPAPPSTAAHRPSGGAAESHRSRRFRELRGDLDAIVLQALAKDRRRRYPSVDALAEDLRRHRAGLPVRARAAGRVYRAIKLVRRHRWVAMSAAVTLVALLLGLAGTGWQAAVAAAERDRTAAQAVKAESVQEFLVSLLQAADPYRAAGESWTVEALLDNGIAKIEERPPDEPAVTADLLAVMGGVSRSLGRFEQAEALWRRSLELQRRHAGDESEVAEGLRGLAAVLYQRSSYDEAETLLREALAIGRRRATGDDRDAFVELAATLDQLGILVLEQERIDEADGLYTEALELRRRWLGVDHVDVAATLSNLGGLSRRRGDYAAAERLYRDCLAIERRALGQRHPGVAVTLSNLAGLLGEVGDFDGAEPLAREALAIAREAYGEDHPAVSTNLNNLAALLRNRGEYDEAAELFAEVLASDREQLGDGHPYVGYSLDNLASVLGELGRLDEAVALYRQAHEILAATRGPDSVAVAISLLGRGVVLRRRGEPGAARPLIEQSVAIFRAQLDPAHPRVARALTELAEVQAGLERRSEAARLFGEALAIRRASEPSAHPDTVAVLTGLGRLLTASAEPASALPHLEEAVRMAQAVLPRGHWRRPSAELALAEALVAQGQVERASRLARGVREELADRSGYHADSLRRMADQLLGGDEL